MGMSHIRYVLVMFGFLVLCFSAFSIMSWLFVSSVEIHDEGNEKFNELAGELKTLEHRFLASLSKWEYRFMNHEATNGYDTSILEELDQMLTDVDEKISLGMIQNSETLNNEHDYQLIENIMVNFEKHVSKLQTLDNLLVIKLQRKYSQVGMEKALPWLRHTSLPPGKTWRSLQTNTPTGFNMVIFNDYNFNTLRQSLTSLTTCVAYSFLDRSHKCLFVLGKPRENPKIENVQNTLELIKHVRFCQTIIWRLDDLEDNQVTGSFSTWWTVMEGIFGKSNSRGNTNTKGFFHNYENDILFLEENVILSEDALEVTLFASLVKNTLTGIWQFALGGDGGETNTVNAHPDTFVVRKSAKFLGSAYGFNASAWKKMKKLKIFRGENKWNIDVGKIIAGDNKMGGFRVIVPTLARFHVATKNIPWSLATRTIDMNLATVSKGIRDAYGFLCDPSLLVPDENIAQVECTCSSRKWNWKLSKKMYCSVQPFHVQDKCFSGKYLELH